MRRFTSRVRCFHKKLYWSKSEAVHFAAKISRKRKKKGKKVKILYPYQCNSCKFYHLTSEVQEEASTESTG